MSKSSGTPVISLPKGGGALKGIGEAFSPDLHTGTGNFTVPIPLPPGRNGFQPDLKLAYSSGSGNGPFGPGWSLGIPSITRKTARGIPRYRDDSPDPDDHDTFVLSGAEDLVPVAGGAPSPTRYRPRTETSFARILHHTTGQNYWEVRTREGLVSWYGMPGTGGASSVLANPTSGQAHEIFAWKLARTVDPFHNQIEYSYEHVSGPGWKQLYLSEIRYADFAQDGGTAFLWRVHLRYESRRDAFSDFTAGFEIRTDRRCTGLDVYLQRDGTAVRTFSCDLVYLDQLGDPPEKLPLNGSSLLAEVRMTGYDGDQSEALPPLSFRYTGFEPEKQRYQPFTAVGGHMPERSLGHGEYELVDLDGNGLPDVIQLGETARYWRNLGDGRFDAPRPMLSAPAFANLAAPGVQIGDFNGDGRADLLVTDGTRAGYYPLGERGGWEERSYVPCAQAPSFNLEDPNVRLVDLDGDGVTDALRTGPTLELWYNHPRMGWHRVQTVTRGPHDEFPDVWFSDPRVKLADLNGDGLQDIVFLQNGHIAYWPYQGCGRWGRRVVMTSAPRFDDAHLYSGAGFDPRRLLLGDVDGDGLADLIYVGAGKTTVWINRSGNSWSDPLTIHGTPEITDLDAVRLADMYGNGTAGILWTYDYQARLDSTYKFLDLTGGVKPYLLSEVDNRRGAVTRNEYTSSTRLFLADEQQPSTRWKTTLPLPVQVIARVERIDQISGGKLVTSFRYRHGYWDGLDREFRGFGLVEQLDTEHFTDFNAPGSAGNRVTPAQYSPPLLTRTWFHQGPVHDASLAWQVPDLSPEFWQEDPHLLAPTPAPADRDAARALRSSVLRTELYALDGTELQDRPYTVTESQYGLREESPPGPGEHGRCRIWFPHLLATRTTQWERGSEPMTSATFTTAYDAYGQPLSRVTAAVPRGRNPRLALTAPPPEPYLVTRTETDYARADTADQYLVDRVTRTTEYEVSHDGTLPLLELVRRVQAGAAARQLIGQTLSFFDGPTFTGLGFGELGPYGALVRTETLVLTEELLGADAASPHFTPNSTDPTRPGLAVTPLGYGFSEGGAGSPYARGYFAATDRKAYDFQTGAGARGLVGTTMAPMGGSTAIEHDPYGLFPVRITDAAELVTVADYDYRVGQPSLVTDPNGNRTAIRFTPAGLLESAAVMGKAGEATGDSPDQPSVRHSYDLHAFADRGQPVSVRTEQRLHHATETDIPLPGRDRTVIRVEFSDGFGRLLQVRTQAEEVRFGEEPFGSSSLPADLTAIPGPAAGHQAPPDQPPVAVSGWQVYDNKGLVVEKYEPFFAAGWAYQQPGAGQTGQKSSLFYDPLGRVIRTVHPDGSEERVIRGVPTDLTEPGRFTPTPWENCTYDSNDNAGRTHPAAATAYQHHWNTPAGTTVDALGRTVATVARGGADPTSWLRTRSTYDIRGNLLTVTDPLGRIAFRHTYDLANQVLRTESIDTGVQSTIWNAGGLPAEQRDSKGALVRFAYDKLNRPVRRWARDAEGDPLTLREVQVYGDSPDSGLTQAQARAANLLGRIYRQYDEAGQISAEAYDFKGALAEKVRRVIRPDRIRAVFAGAAASNWRVSAFRVDWQPPEGIGLEAHAETLLDPARYQTSSASDALGRLKTLRYPQDATGARKLLRPRYNRAGALEQVEMDGRLFVDRIAYNAKGQRILIAYGNGVMTRYAYDARTFRLLRLRTERYRVDPAVPLTYQPAAPHAPLQDLGYAYDLAGNLLAVRDRTPGSGIPGAAAGADALDRAFAYDPLYRLLSATGRECDLPPELAPWSDGPRCTDLTRTRPYTQGYEYDAAGNLTHIRHGYSRSDGTVAGFNRLLTPAGDSNRLQSVTVNNLAFAYRYDLCGNLVQENTERHFEWDHANRLRVFRIQPGTAEPSIHVHYLYDATGQRVMKYVRRQGGQEEVTVYIDGIYEHFRWGAGSQNSRLHVMDNQRRVAVWRVGETHPGDAGPDLQYHLGDHLGSSSLTVDEAGSWTNREEYTPYGETSFGSFAQKRYRFTGKERDEESGLYYHGARYYAPWLARWVSCDPAGTVDGLNLYQYVRAAPMQLSDPTGLNADSMEDPELRKLVEEVGEQAANKGRSGTQVQPAGPQRYKRERKAAKNATYKLRKESGLTGRKDIEVAHLSGVKEATQAQLPRRVRDNPQNLMIVNDELSSPHKGQVTLPDGSQVEHTHHNTVDDVTDSIRENTKRANGGKIGAQGEADLIDEAKWRLQGTRIDQREVFEVKVRQMQTGRNAGRVARALDHLGTAAKRAGAAIPIVGITFGHSSAAHAATKGDLQGAALDEAGFIPIAGDLLDAFRAGYAVGEAINEFLPPDVQDAIGGTIAETLENGWQNIKSFYF